MARNALITGAEGFVGSRLREVASERGHVVRGTCRASAPGFDGVAVGPIGPQTDWSAALKGVDRVIHLASRVHVMDEAEDMPLVAFRHVNVEGTRGLGEQAAEAGVRRFVYLSSIKVNGEATNDKPFRPSDRAAPEDPYGISKMEAEQALGEISQRTGMEVVVIRPTLVYGPGVKANFLRLLGAVAKGLPLPFGLVDNRRSLVALDNLVDLIVRCLDHPAAAGRTFLVSDGEDLSTPELVRRIARAMGRPARLLPVPVSLLRAGGKLLRREALIDRLVGSLQVDDSETRRVLDWRPPVTVDEALEETVRWYLAQGKRAGVQ